MILQKEFIKNLAMRGQRLDGRKEDETRKLVIETGVIENAEGSARVWLGKTQVLVGVKLSVAEPFSDTPDEGILMSNAELSPLASPEWERGPPSDESIELARVVDRGIRESKAIEMKKLCIKEGEKVWMVCIDSQPINDDGNLMDAAGIGAMAALLTAKMPHYDEKEDEIDYHKRDKKLPVKFRAIPVTHVKVGDKFLADPCREEERASTARFTVTTKEGGNVCSMQKGGADGFTQEEVLSLIERSAKKADEIRKHLKE